MAINFYFANPSPSGIIDYGFTSTLEVTVSVSGTEPPYMYDTDFYTGTGQHIGSTVSGTISGQAVTEELTTQSGIEYSWYVTVTTSGEEDTSPTYSFDNRFLSSGTVTEEGIPLSGALVRLYRRSSGELVGYTDTLSNGTFNIDTIYTDEHYCIAFNDDQDYNAIIYDHLTP